MQGKNVLTLLNGVPAYDLAGDRLCIALFIKRNGTALDFYCHLKPATSDRMIKLLQERYGYILPVSGKEGGVEHHRGSLDVDRKFFDEHLIEVTYQGQALTAEQLDRLDNMNSIRLNAIGRGLMMVGSPTVSDESAPKLSPTIDEILADEDETIAQRVLLADDAGDEHELDIVHHFDAPSAKQSTDYVRSQKRRTMEGGAQKIVINFKEIGKLYDALIQSVDGVIGDRAMIVAKLPFVWKFNAIETLFRDAQRKNV